MKIGCCTNMIATGSEGTGVEFVEKLAKLGFDYIELPLAQMTALPNESFLSLAKKVEASGIRCEVCNNFFPQTIKLTGPDVDEKAISAYVDKALDRAAALGVEHVVFGSGPAKNVPDGFPLEEGYSQIVDLLHNISPIAKKHGITIVIEPLRKAECNLINTFAEGCKLAKDVAADHVKVLVDFYHLRQESEPIRHLSDNGREYLRHVHFARNDGRGYPAKPSEDVFYEPFFSALKEIGYERRISLEAYTSDFSGEIESALRFFRDYTGAYTE